MAILYTKVKLYLEANSKTWDDTKVSLQNNSDGNGDFISSWTYDGLEKPTNLTNVEGTKLKLSVLNLFPPTK